MSGYIRVAYALLFLYSRILMALELKFLMDPRTGVMPYRATRHLLNEVKQKHGIFQCYPDSPLVLYGVFYLGLFNGLLLLLGIAPRLNAIGVFCFLYNMHHHSQVLYDHQDVMLRLWAFFLILMPLDHITIYDKFGLEKKSSNSHQTQSWPMWPIQLWRIVTCMVYMGAGIGKLTSVEGIWQNGTAIFWCLVSLSGRLRLQARQFVRRCWKSYAQQNDYHQNNDMVCLGFGSIMLGYHLAQGNAKADIYGRRSITHRY